ncbi:ribosomal protein S18-alanine N-acetyltransferase [Shewanella sp. SR44-3]|uniref:ribosomal protein S18-alanine N-acetyltransferase n=1 Tax=Shewanella sp. SR44-3 TaxID=2760936 RepID=UPI0015FBDE7E|nr:ribosomal protein S18-alanine N-acetyltransferase [Shewanella sp. SR44-3]MBB1270017.1 ribosomal protein S18-alanine N-acetyltransferase [Shewanella sp. SR44-3]
MHSTQYVVRPLVEAHLDAMLLIEHAAHSHPWSLANLADCFGRLHYGAGLFLQQAGGPDALVGFFLMQQVIDEASLLDICVDPKFQGQGLGRLLMKQLIDEAVNRDAAVIMLEVRASNVGAIHLYQSLGFIEVSRRKNYYQSQTGYEDAILMDLTFN